MTSPIEHYDFEIDEFLLVSIYDIRVEAHMNISLGKKVIYLPPGESSKMHVGDIVNFMRENSLIFRDLYDPDVILVPHENPTWGYDVVTNKLTQIPSLCWNHVFPLMEMYREFARE